MKGNLFFNECTRPIKLYYCGDSQGYLHVRLVSWGLCNFCIGYSQTFDYLRVNNCIPLNTFTTLGNHRTE